MKKCNVCLEEKPKTEFYKVSSYPHLVRYSCKTCSKARSIADKRKLAAQKKEKAQE